MSDSGGRYHRSMAGMIGAMLVTLLVIAGFVAFRDANRADLAIEAEPVDYIAVVDGVQESGADWLAYPPALPEGWIARAVAFDTGPEWSLSMLTDEERFVGLRQVTGAEVTTLVEEYVDEQAIEGEPVRLESSLSDTWRTFTDEGGDYALAAEVGDTVVLVVGTAPEDEIEAFTASLVTGPVG